MCAAVVSTHVGRRQPGAAISCRHARGGGRPAADRWSSLRPCVCLGAFTLLAVLHTWPLATAPGRLSRNDNADTILNEWTMAWVAHQLPRHPLHLFDANIFYPEQ